MNSKMFLVKLEHFLGIIAKTHISSSMFKALWGSSGSYFPSESSLSVISAPSGKSRAVFTTWFGFGSGKILFSERVRK